MWRGSRVQKGYGMPRRPSICLNMIARNEAHIVCEVLDCVAPLVDYWVIVDTGSDDGTQELVRNHTAALGIAGELHERPWRNFGANRSEALDLAQGHCDYIWVIDADDLVVGTIDLSSLTVDLYEVRFGQGFTYWRAQILKDGLPWSYRGVVHEYVHCPQPITRARLDGDYHIESRRLGSRSSDPEKYARDCDLLLAELDHNPDDERSVFYLAQSYRDYGDFASALKWYTRRAEMGRWAEEVYCSLYQAAECLKRLDEPWPMVQDAYLKAWAYRPTRAEALYAIALHYMAAREWQLGYFFAERAAYIAMPDDVLFLEADVYTFSALDVQAVCASWLGKHEEAFGLCRRLLELENLNDSQRDRIATNRDFSIPALLEAARAYPEELAHSIANGPRNSDVTLTVVSHPDRAVTERTLNSFLRCCVDVERIGRFVLVDVGMIESDRKWLRGRYPFLEFHSSRSSDVNEIRHVAGGRLWMHLPPGWQFFAAENLVGRTTAVLEAEPDIDQVGINLGDAEKSDGTYASRDSIKRTNGTGGYVLTTQRSKGPMMTDTTRLSSQATARCAATLDEVLAVKESS